MKKNKKKEKKRRYRLFYLLLLLLITTLSLSVSSYAWFTTNRLVRVDLLNVNVRAQGGIEISVDGTNWKSSVSVDDIITASDTYPTNTNQIPQTLEAVSTVGKIENGKITMYHGNAVNNATGNYVLETTRSIEVASAGENSTGKFITFDLFFKVNAATPIYLQAGSGVTSADEKDNGIKNASRIAFVKLGETADGSALNTIQALNAGAASTVTVWEPNFDVHTDAGVANAKDVYGITTTAANGALVPYAGIKGAITKAEDILLGEATQEKHEDKFTTVTPGKTSTAAFPANIELMTLNKGITKVRIYMWVEGQDVDCENNASGGNINFDLKISTNAA